MPTTFANTINSNPIYADRAEKDAAGNTISTTYATTASLAAVATSGDYGDLSNTPTIPSGAQLVPAATSADADKVLTVDSQGIPGWAVVPSGSTGLFEAVYGQTSYSAITQAISDKKIVYCRISATGASRMAFLAYIGTSNVEFQYYRSLNSHSASSMTDEVYVYTVSSSGWTTTTRKTGVKVVAGTHMTQSYSSDTLTLNATWPTVDQTYDASSTNAQSGVAVASALASVQAGLFEATYGTTTYADVLQAISDNKIVYCNAPGSGNTRRMAVMTFQGTTNVEFQYYRSNSSGTDSVFIYTVSSEGWDTTERTVTGYAASTYNASSTLAQSGVAVAQAIGGLPTSLTSAQIQSFKQALGVDETVLWTGSMYLNNDSDSLSESIDNFESVAIYGAPIYGGALQRYEFLVDTSGTPAYRIAMPAADGSAAYHAFFNLNISTSTATVTRSRLVKILYSDGSVTTADFTSSSTLKAYIKKIVGVHRIANN